MKTSFCRFVNWQTVRIFGELRLLTRASYFLLVFVPVLAGLWPSVGIAVRQYNRVAASATDKLEVAEQEFNQAAMRLNAALERKSSSSDNVMADLSELVSKVDADVADVLSDLRPQQAVPPKLPRIWGTAFFAAFFVLLGHWCYEALASPIVQKYSQDALEKERMRAYAEAPTKAKMDAAFAELKKLEGAEATPPHYLERELQPVVRSDEVIIDDSNEEKANRNRKNREARESAEDLEYVQLASIAEYGNETARNKFGAFLSFVLYCIGTFFLLSILFMQAHSVAIAVGWL